MHDALEVAAQTSAELWIAIGALVTSIGGAVAALLRLGPERQVNLVGAQDTVIDNLREEVDRQRAEHLLALEAVEGRYRRRIAHLERQLEEEAETCERRITELQERITALEHRTPTEEEEDR